MRKRSVTSILTVGAVCAVAGAAASGIASSSAATKSTAAGASAASRAAAAGGGLERFGGRGPGGHGDHGRGPGGPGGGIHSEIVLPDPAGSGFVTIVNDTGTLSAIDGTSLTLKEGTASQTFGTVKLAADGTVTVERNGASAKLSDLALGDHVRVSKDGSTTRIDATTAAFDTSQAAARAQRDQQRGAGATWPAL